jgi:hypothetical protein
VASPPRRHRSRSSRSRAGSVLTSRADQLSRALGCVASGGPAAHRAPGARGSASAARAAAPRGVRAIFGLIAEPTLAALLAGFAVPPPEGELQAIAGALLRAMEAFTRPSWRDKTSPPDPP